MKYGLLGERLGHSFSKIIHSMIGDYEYELCEVERSKLEGFLEKRDFIGINVTIPYKELIIPHLYSISDKAKSIGAVNTVVNRGGKLYGYNTDYDGLRLLAERTEIDFLNKKVAILGTGGTSKTAYSVAEGGGAGEIIKVSRTGKGEAVTYSELYEKHPDVDIIINTTPCGMYPEISGCPVDLDRFTSLCGVLDVIYNPLETELVLNSKRKNIKASGGLYMLVMQAVKASEIFFKKEYEAGLADRIYNELLKEKQNIVLIGMPSSGKTTVGRLLSERLKRGFYDTDELFERKHGMSAADFIRQNGEESFRDEESAIAFELSKIGGAVISVGGGTVLRVVNVFELKKNGRIFWLDRDLSLLVTTSDRPLSSTKEKLCELYTKRRPIYKEAADVIIEANGTAKEAMERIILSL